MRKVKNVSGLIEALRSKLPEYLLARQTLFSGNDQNFQCPNRVFHANNDLNFSCGFFPDRQHFKCFACSEKGDIFDALYFLEGKPRDGATWIQESVLYLADLLKVAYDYEELSPEEQ